MSGAVERRLCLNQGRPLTKIALRLYEGCTNGCTKVALSSHDCLNTPRHTADRPNDSQPSRIFYVYIRVTSHPCSS